MTKAKHGKVLIKNDLRKRIEAFEIWAKRRMLAISWSHKVTNEEILHGILHLILRVTSLKRGKLGVEKCLGSVSTREWTGILGVAEVFGVKIR